MVEVEVALLILAIQMYDITGMSKGGPTDRELERGVNKQHVDMIDRKEKKTERPLVSVGQTSRLE